MRRIVFLGFAATIALAPLPLGSNRAWSWSPLAVVVGGLLLAWTAANWIQADHHRPAFARFGALLVPSALLAVVVGWGFLQLSGWTPAAWKSPISAAAALGLAAPSSSAMAFEREQALTGTMRLLTYAGVFVLGASLPASAADVRRLLGTIVCSATIYTLYAVAAIVANAPATGITLWTQHVTYTYVLSGPFINANTFATYAGVATLTALALAAQAPPAGGFRETTAQQWRRRLRAISGHTGFWLATALILATGVLLSASRAGGVSLVVAVLVMVALYTRGIGRLAFTVLTVFSVALVAILMPAGRTLVLRTARLVAEGESGREALFAMTLNAISLRPLAGWGMNSFESLYFLFQPIGRPEYFDKAHNTYLELAFDLGIPAAAMLVLAVAWIVTRCLVGFFNRGRDRELAGLGFFAAVLVGVHALFDFSLQIPGMACTFFAILGLAWSQSWSTRPARGEGQ
jgi:O-antigen ligase